MKNTLKRHYQLNCQKGVTLLSLMVGIAVSAILLLMIAELTSISKQNYLQAQNIIELNENGRDAIEFLKKYVAMGGFGVTPPVPPGNVQLNSSGRTPALPPAGTFAALPDWTYIGYYGDPVPQFTQVVAAADSIPESCASTMDTSYSSLQFFYLQSCGQCNSPDSTGAAFDKSQLTNNPNDNTATCCQPSSSNCQSDSNYCSVPNYNCGGLSQGAVYQKLKQPICVGITCAGANPSVNPSGDVLTVYFSNPGPSNITTMMGTTVGPNAVEPPPQLSSYTFQVDTGSSTLQAIDSTTGTTAYNIANNIEYMAVLVGESDLSSTLVGNYSAPQVNRYVQYGTSNLYPYRIIAVRVGIVARTSEPILSAVPSTTNITVMLGNDGNPIIYTAPADQYLRKVYTTTIFLNSYTLPQYLPHCVNVSGSYYLKGGGIPFATTWTANDECCGGPPCTATDFDTCEANRMLGGCDLSAY